MFYKLHNIVDPAAKETLLIQFIFRNVISSWSSGTGAAGVTGAFTYAALISIGLTRKSTLLLMLIVPALEAVVFFCLLRNPKRVSPGRHPDMSASPSSATIEESLINSSTALYRNHVRSPELPPPIAMQQHPLLGVKAKVKYIPKLFKYLLPLFTVYLCEYFINQGLVSTIHRFQLVAIYIQIPTNFIQWILIYRPFFLFYLLVFTVWTNPL